MKKRLISILTALLLLMASLPAFASQRSLHPTPAGYNDHDYQKMADFLDNEITITYFGQSITRRIYEWLQMVDSSFNINDPSTWHAAYNGVTQVSTQWTSVDGEQRLSVVWGYPTFTSFSGYSGCPLDLSGCEYLQSFTFSVFRFTSLDLSNCPNLTVVICRDNNITSSVNLTGCTNLDTLDLTGCPLTELDLTTCPLLPFDTIRANGSGKITFANGTACATPDSGKQFLGWYAENGEFISDSAQLSAESTDHTRVQARFTGAVVVVHGDADGDGSVTVSDALTLLRASMGIVPTTPEMIGSCDADNDGAITINDAMLVLRFAMGLTAAL